MSTPTQGRGAQAIGGTCTSGSHQRIRPDDVPAIEVPDTRQADPEIAGQAPALAEPG